MNKLRVCFMGTPEFAVPVLKELIANTDVILVVSQPDKLVGRKRQIEFSPIKKLAIENDINIYQPEKIRKEYQRIIDLKPDIIITCAYGQIIPKEVLDCPKYGCINVHASVLPKLRGGAPLNHAIIDGYDETGVTIMYMDEGMDTGDIIAVSKYKIKDTDTVLDLIKQLSCDGAKLLIKTLPDIVNNKANRIKQDNNEATYAYIIKRDEERIDCSKTVEEVDRLVRGLNTEPYANIVIDDVEYKVIKCHFEKKTSEIGKIEISKKEFGIGCSNGVYYIDIIKPSGKKEMDIKAFLNGIDKNKFSSFKIK